jgi:hypothetical protein
MRGCGEGGHAPSAAPSRASASCSESLQRGHDVFRPAPPRRGGRRRRSGERHPVLPAQPRHVPWAKASRLLQQPEPLLRDGQRQPPAPARGSVAGSSARTALTFTDSDVEDVRPACAPAGPLVCSSGKANHSTPKNATQRRRNGSKAASREQRCAPWLNARCGFGCHGDPVRKKRVGRVHRLSTVDGRRSRPRQHRPPMRIPPPCPTPPSPAERAPSTCTSSSASRSCAGGARRARATERPSATRVFVPPADPRGRAGPRPGRGAGALRGATCGGDEAGAVHVLTVREPANYSRTVAKRK